MPDYLKGMIYMLEPSCKHDIKDIYYGSTTQPLHDRFHSHKSKFITNRGKHVYFQLLAFAPYHFNTSGRSGPEKTPTNKLSANRIPMKSKELRYD